MRIQGESLRKLRAGGADSLWEWASRVEVSLCWLVGDFGERECFAAGGAL